MIIGNGLIANAFDEYRYRDDILIFASGVSNSLEHNNNAFLRESHILHSALKKSDDILFVYFGTCSIYDPSLISSPYIKHKIEMERMVTNIASRYIIMRLPQVVGNGGNNATLVNYLYYNIVNEIVFDLWTNAIRYLVKIDDVVKFSSFVIERNDTSNKDINFSKTPSISVYEIVKYLEKIIGKSAIYREVNKGANYSIPILSPSIMPLDANIVFKENYTKKILEQYCYSLL